MRRAEARDIDDLAALESRCFSTDRLSRRSLRDLMRSPTAILLVAELGGRPDSIASVIGDALVLFRKGTAAARLYSIAVAPEARGVGAAARLLESCERLAYEAGRIQLRLEVGVANVAARALYRRAGYREIASLPAYYEDGSDALRMTKLLRPLGHGPDAPPYYEQTTDFTCGPACLMMALAHFVPGYAPDPLDEVRLWREATMIFMSSGLGGCGPYGMAVALAGRGLAVEIHVSRAGDLLLQTVASEEKRRVMRLAQQDFRKRAQQLGIPVRHRRCSVAALARRLRGGALATLLISGNRMFAKRVPHWVLAYAADDDHVMIHDPWVEGERLESATDAVAIPIPFAELDRMWHWGKSGLRAMVLVEGPRASRTEDDR